jgi:hypothetical protein
LQALKERVKAAKELETEKKKRLKEGRPTVNEKQMQVVNDAEEAAEAGSINAGSLAETADRLSVRAPSPVLDDICAFSNVCFELMSCLTHLRSSRTD